MGHALEESVKSITTSDGRYSIEGAALDTIISIEVVGSMPSMPDASTCCRDVWCSLGKDDGIDRSLSPKDPGSHSVRVCFDGDKKGRMQKLREPLKGSLACSRAVIICFSSVQGDQRGPLWLITNNLGGSL